MNFREDVWQIPWNHGNFSDNPPPPRCLVTFLPVFSSLWLLHSIRVNAQIGAGHNGEMFHRFGGVGHAGGGCFHTFQLKSASNNRTLREIWEGKAPGVGWWMTEKWDRYLKYLKKGQAPNWRNLQRFPTPLRPPSFQKKKTQRLAPGRSGKTTGGSVGSTVDRIVGMVVKVPRRVVPSILTPHLVGAATQSKPNCPPAVLGHWRPTMKTSNVSGTVGRKPCSNLDNKQELSEGLLGAALKMWPLLCKEVAGY